MGKTARGSHPAPAGSTSKQPVPAQLKDAANQTPEHEPHPTKTDCSLALQDHPAVTSLIARPPLHPGTAQPTLRKTTATIKTETLKGLAEPGKQPEAKLTPHEVR